MNKYKIVATANGLLGITEMFTSLFLLFFALPKLTSLYSEFGARPPSLSPAYLVLGLVLLMAIANLLIAVKLFSMAKAKKDKYLKHGVILLIVALIIFGLLIGVASFSSTIPIYNLTSQLK